jgi:hypothetical protein
MKKSANSHITFFYLIIRYMKIEEQGAVDIFISRPFCINFLPVNSLFMPESMSVNSYFLFKSSPWSLNLAAE